MNTSPSVSFSITSEIQKLAKIGSWERDLTSGVMTWSPEARMIVDVPKGMTISEYIAHYVHPDDRERVAYVIGKGIAEESGYDVEYRITLGNGEQKNVRVSTIVMPEEPGQTKKIQGFIQDITSWIAAQDKLAEQRFLLRESQQIAKIGGWEYDLSSQTLVWTDEYYDLIRRRREDYPATMEHYYALLHPDDRKRVYDDMQEAMRGKSNALEYRIILPDGTVRYMRGYGTLVHDATGKVVKLRGVIQDISDTKRTERQLTRLTELLNQAQHLTQLGSWERDLRSGELTWSDEFFRQLGYEPQQFVPEPGDFISHVHPDDRSTVVDALKALVNNSLDELPARFIEYRLFRADGTMRFMRGTGGSLVNTMGEVVITFGTLQDITPVKEAQIQLQASEAKFRRLFEQSSVGQIMYDHNLSPVQANAAFLGMLGYTAEEFERLPYLATLHADDHHKFNEQMQALWLGNIPSVQADMRFMCKSGAVVWCRIQASVFQYALYPGLHSVSQADSERYILVAAEDITQYRQVEEAIQKTVQRERETFDLRNQMMARLSHNLQTPLSAIALATNIMQKHHARMPEEKMMTYLGNILESVGEIQSLIGNVVIIGKLETGRAQLAPTPVNIVPFCKRLYGEFVVKYPHRPLGAAFVVPDNAALLADHELLHLILWHLLVFLDKGLERGAEVQCVLEADNHTTTGAIQILRWHFSCEKQAYNHAHPDIAALLNEDENTTASAANPAEIGLSTIRQAVRLHGGTLTGSNDGRRTRVILAIPALG